MAWKVTTQCRLPAGACFDSLPVIEVGLVLTGVQPARRGSVLVFELLVRPSVNRGRIHNLKILYTCMNPINGACEKRYLPQRCVCLGEGCPVSSARGDDGAKLSTLSKKGRPG